MMSVAPDPITCFGCGTANDPGSENCFRCGRGLFALTEGAMLAGRYQILKPLGKGGMGMVYRALDQELDETVAVKVLRPEVSLSPDMTARFRSEIKLARRVSHRNVCRIHEYGRDGYLTYIVMEFVDGRDLRQTVREQGAMPHADAYGIAVQLAEGLQAIHEVGIVHRDLKTANIMLDRQGQVKLMDFGIAKSLLVEATSGATATGHIVGTPEYMSPEQARAEKVDLRSDIYSFGVILFELFSGDVPFRGETPVATLMKHLQESPPLEGAQSHKMPAALIPILGRALAKPREDRFSSARDLLEALRKAQDHPATSAAATWIMERPGGLPSTRQAPLHLPPAPTTPLPAPMPLRPEAERLPPARVAVPLPTPPPPPARVRPAAPEAPKPAPPRAAPPTPPPAPRPTEARSRRSWIAGAALAVAALGGAVVVGWLMRAPDAPAPERSPPRASVDARGETGSVPSLGASLPPAPTASTIVMNPTRAAPPAPSLASTMPARPATIDAPRAARPAPIVAPTTPATAAVRSPEPAAAVPAATAPEGGERTPPPEPTALLAGRLQLRVVPWAEVWVDGVSAGTTPLKPLSLPPGTHTVRLTHPAFQPLTRKVDVRAGQTTLLDIDLKFEAFPKKED